MKSVLIVFCVIAVPCLAFPREIHTDNADIELRKLYNKLC